MGEDILQVDNKMHELMKNLLNAPLLSRDNLKDIPSKGLYVFYENDTPIYVGISGKNRMKKRIMGHGRKSGVHNSATFAFNIAKKDAEKIGLNIKEKRKILQKKNKLRWWKEHDKTVSYYNQHQHLPLEYNI
jgi:hypothetical protein